MQSPSESRVRRFGINAVSSVGARLLSITVLVWVNQHLLRRIEPEEYSLFPLVMSLVVFNSLFVSIFTGGVSRHLVEADARGDDREVTGIVSSMLVVLVPVSLLLGLLGGLAAWRIDLLIEVAPDYLGQARFMFLLTVISMCLTTATAPLAEGLYIRERFVTENILQLVCEALRIVLLLTLLFAARTRVVWLVVASTIASLVNQALHIWLTRELLKTVRFDRHLVSWKTVKRVLSFGAWTSVGGIAQLLSGTAPILLLNRFASPLDVAIFHAGRMPESQLRAMLQAIEGPAQPALIGLYARGGKEAVDALYYQGGRYYLWLALLPVAPLLVFAEPLYRLYAGDRYASAGLVMCALIGCFPMLFASGMYYRVAHAIGRIGVFNAYYLALQVATVVAVIYAVGIRNDGAVGAAFAIGITQGLAHLFLIWPLGLRLVGGRWSEFARQTLLRGLLPFTAALGTCLLFGRVVSVDSWWTLCAGSAVGVLVYMVVLMSSCLDAPDRSLFERGLRQVGIR